MMTLAVFPEKQIEPRGCAIVRWKGHAGTTFRLNPCIKGARRRVLERR